MFRSLSKNKAFAGCLLLLITTAAFCEDFNKLITSGSTPETAVEQLLSDESLTAAGFRERLIAAAEIKQVTGDLSAAADLFKKASLAVKGSKDFISLYRSALIRVEVADYRTAEADIRAITTFSDDLILRIKANILLSRIKIYQSQEDEALSIMSEILKNNSKLPLEAYHWSVELAQSSISGAAYDEFKKIYNEQNIAELTIYEIKDKIPTPESVFGLINNKNESQAMTISVPAPAESPEQSAPESEVDVAIQIGSFSRMGNAVDLKKTVLEYGFEAIIKKKTVNGKEYNVVVIPVKEINIQPMIIKLKEKGFEGYPLY
jgi:tetratricopeptide (TPR) repeat protein